MKFLVLVTLSVLFLNGYVRASSESESEEYSDEDDYGFDPRLFASAMQLNNNNVGDIKNVKVNFDGELHNKMSADIITMLLQMINADGWGDDSDSESESESESYEDIEECPDEGIKFISHPDDCEKYILCIDGDEVATLTCPDGFHFSRDLRSCTDPDEAECED